MPLEHEITKKENNLLLKQYKILKRVKYLENDKIIYIKYYLGEKIMSDKKITLESLAERVDDLTSVVNNLALEMRAGFKSINDRLDKVESRLDKVESRLDNLERDVSELKIKVNNIDDRLAIIEREATKHGWDLNSDK